MPEQEITQVYIFTCVSMAIQIDGFSLETQKTRMRAFVDYSNYKIVREYEDVGGFWDYGILRQGLCPEESRESVKDYITIAMKRTL